MMVQMEYRKKPVGIGLEFGMSESGFAKGIALTTKDTLIFWEVKDREYMTLSHRVNSVSPYFRYYADNVAFQLGISYNDWEVSRDENKYSVSGKSFGGNVGFIIALVDNRKFRLELTSIYRIMGREKIGPVTKVNQKERTFSESEISFNHFQVGLSFAWNLHKNL